MSSSKDQEQAIKQSKETFAYKFWQEFQEERGAIQKSMNELSQKSRSSIPLLCEGLLQRISVLEKKTTDASIFLPSYDQRQSILQIRALIEDLNTKKAELAPKSKFSFKSRKATGSTEKSMTVESNKIVNSGLDVVTPNNKIPITNSLNQNFQTVTLNYKQNCYISVNSYLTNLEEPGEKVMDFQISNLDHCIVNLVSSNVTIGAIHIKGLKDTIIMSGPVRSSILIHDCERCVFLIGCHQFRMHTSRQMTIYLHTTSHPIIEDCNNILFAPYTLSVPSLGNMFEAAKLDPTNNKYDKVEDFNWLRQQASPNWQTVLENKILKDWPFLHVDDPKDEETVLNVLNEILGSQLIS